MAYKVKLSLLFFFLLATSLMIISKTRNFGRVQEVHKIAVQKIAIKYNLGLNGVDRIRTHIKRESPSGPDPIHHNSPPPFKEAHELHELHDTERIRTHVKRESPSGPDPIHHNSPPPFKEAHNLHDTERIRTHIKRESPSGPDPIHHNSPPPFKDAYKINNL
ncbi:myosin light chain kinase, smooth muscle-like [Melia azedarach]|uniref:Myosin light chain kinase, smooth muscle-like n=1 Tax=Melia azedarach TaxID=155640 RepID=A0ACC1X8E9_MELAZ|nr:myosin light chain kinase, smooth muscle-like [Melia azedarach]